MNIIHTSTGHLTVLKNRICSFGGTSIIIKLDYQKMMTENMHPNDPLHGITLEMILNRLVAKYGWLELSKLIPIRCFFNEPSIKSSLKFLRRTPWARKKVEELYINTNWSSEI